MYIRYNIGMYVCTYVLRTYENSFSKLACSKIFKYIAAPEPGTVLLQLLQLKVVKLLEATYILGSYDKKCISFESRINLFEIDSPLMLQS